MPCASGPDTGNVHAVSVHTHLAAYEVIRDQVTVRDPLTPNRNTLTLPEAKAYSHFADFESITTFSVTVSAGSLGIARPRYQIHRINGVQVSA